MMHPPTYYAGPLQPDELAEPADLLDDCNGWISELDSVPEDLAIRIGWWAYRLANIGARR